jgi:hypothetical protein
MLDILLIVVIGGMGTMYGAVIGAVLFVLAQNYLQDLLKLGAGGRRGRAGAVGPGHPDRWLLWLGVLFVLSVYHFPTGIVGRLRARTRRSPLEACKEGRAMTATIALPGCEGREIHVTEWGDPTAEAVVAWHGLARTGRDMDDIAATWRALARDLPRHPRPRPEPVEPGTRRRVLPGLLRAAGRLAARPAGRAAMPLARHLDGRCDRPACGGRRAARAHPAPGAQRHRPAAGRRPAVERIRSYAGSPPAFATMGELEPTSAPSTSPTAG